MTNVRETIRLEAQLRVIRRWYNSQVLPTTDEVDKILGEGPASLHTETCVCRDCRDVNDT